MRFRLVAATIGGVLFGVPHPTAAQDVAPARGDISGYWHYNVTKSDRPPSGFGDNAGETSRGGFGSGRRGSGSAGGGGGIGGGMGGRPAISEAERSRIRQTVQLATTAPSTLRIFRNDSMVTLVEEAIADTLRLYTNGKRTKEQVEGAGDVETRAEWKDNGLMIERKVNGGGKVTETYFRTSDNRQMMVIVKLETSKSPKPVEFRRVYDAVSGGP